MTALTAILGPHASTDQIDEAIHGLIDLHFAGHLSEEAARREISGCLYASGIHEQVAARRTDLSPQGRSDLAEMLSTLLTEKMISGGNFYSFAIGRTQSACGWARQLAGSAMQSELRKVRRSDTRNGTPLDPHGHEFSVLAHYQTSLIVYDDPSVRVDANLSDLVEDYTTKSKGMRDTDRVLASAETLCAGFGVAPAIRPEFMVDRDYALKALSADPSLAHRALRTWVSLVHGSDRDAIDASIDDRILSLWDEQTEDSAEQLLALSADVTHMLAVAAVSPLPRPPKKALQKLKTMVMVGNGTRDKAWRDLTSVLVDSYVASEFEAVSQYATMSVDAKQAAATGHTIARGRFETLLDRAAMHPGAPLGRSHSQILARLAQLAETVFVDEPVAHEVAKTRHRKSA